MRQEDIEAVSAWERLVREHPKLARELSRGVFVSKLGESLRQSDAYRSAVHAGDRARAAEVVAGLVQAVLGRLMG